MRTLLGGYLADRFAGEHGRSYFYVCAAGSLLSGLFFLLTFNTTSLHLALGFLFTANLATSLKNGTAVAANMRVAPADLRATSASIIMLAVVVIGASLGPLIVGVVSDIAAARLFPSAFGTFTAVCPGGIALPGASEAVATSCGSASAGGLRIAMLVPSCSFFFSGLLYLIAGRSLFEKIDT